MFFVFKFLVTCQIARASSFCASYEVSSSYLAIKEKVDEKIRVFANSKFVAPKADATLSNLIKAKSPVILNWLKKRDLDTKSEDAIVREWRDYFTRNFILTKYPQGDSSIDSEIEKLIDTINQLFSVKVFKDKMERLFAKTKGIAIANINNMPIPVEQKKKIIGRVDSIKLYWMKDFKSSKFKPLPLDFLDWGIAYDPPANEINIGINSLNYPDDETYIAVLAHEIGHSFDSCRWSAFFDGPWPFQKVGECLRGSKSVNAKTRDDSKLDLYAKENKQLADSLRANPTCNKLVYPPVGMQADQLPESFADWFSAETMAKIENLNVAHLRRDLCEKRELNVGSSYPTNEMRLNGIYFAHPKFKGTRNDLKETYQYCAL